MGDKEEQIEGDGLKLMTPSQLMTRLPILLAQKQAGNNSQKLNNEIRKIIYSLYTSKNLRSYEIYQIQNYFLDEVIKKHESSVKSNE